MRATVHRALVTGTVIVILCSVPVRSQSIQSLGSAGAMQQLNSQIRSDPYRGWDRRREGALLTPRESGELIETRGLEQGAVAQERVRVSSSAPSPGGLASREATVVSTPAVPVATPAAQPSHTGVGRGPVDPEKLSPRLRSLLEKTRVLRERRATAP